MFDAQTQHALDNLATMLQDVKTGKRGTDALRIAAEQVVRVTSPAAVEDRNYFADLEAEVDRCGAPGEHGRFCSRRAGHVSPTHRSMEITWSDPQVGDTVELLHDCRKGTVTEISRWSGRTEYMVDLGNVELGFARSEIRAVNA